MRFAVFIDSAMTPALLSSFRRHWTTLLTYMDAAAGAMRYRDIRKNHQNKVAAMPAQEIISGRDGPKITGVFTEITTVTTGAGILPIAVSSLYAGTSFVDGPFASILENRWVTVYKCVCNSEISYVGFNDFIKGAPRLYTSVNAVPYHMAGRLVPPYEDKEVTTKHRKTVPAEPNRARVTVSIKIWFSKTVTLYWLATQFAKIGSRVELG